MGSISILFPIYTRSQNKLAKHISSIVIIAHTIVSSFLA